MSWLKDLQQKMLHDLLAKKGDVAYLQNAERLELYGDGYMIRFQESMAEDFSITRWAVGNKAFEILVENFIREFPSSEYNLNQVGKKFPLYLSKHSTRNHLFLKDLVQYELNLTQCHHKASIPPIDFSNYQSIALERWAKARFVFQPHVSVQRFDWPVLNLHRAFNQKKPIDIHQIELKKSHLVFYQENDDALAALIEQDEFEAMEKFIEGYSLEEVCDMIDDENAVQSVFEWFQSWNERKFITDINFESDAA
jgi:hypothetical protein